MSRIAAPMVGGMISSTVLTLGVIPALYALVKQWQLRREQRPLPDPSSGRCLPRPLPTTPHPPPADPLGGSTQGAPPHWVAGAAGMRCVIVCIVAMCAVIIWWR